jgi:integrase
LHPRPETGVLEREREDVSSRKGGPRLKGELGTPEFIASYHEAVSAKRAPAAGVLLALLHAYQASSEFVGLRDRTRADYIKQIKLIEVGFGDMPLNALGARGARAEFMAWRDQLATRSRRQADYAWSVLARVLSWSKNRGLVSENPCQRGGRLYCGSRADRVWTADDEAAFYRSAPSHLHLPVLLALWTGQREGDLLRLTWSAYDGETIRLKQSKTGARVSISVGAPLKAVLDVSPRLSPVILLTSDGKPWTSDGFRVVRQGEGQSRDCRRHFQRPARYRSDATGARRGDGSGDRNHHRTLASRCAVDPRFQLPAPRPGPRPRGHPQARKKNKNSQLNSQPRLAGRIGK